MDITAVRKLIDDNFSLQWCRDNYVVPLGVANNTLTLAVANLSYLATVGDTLRERAKDAGYELQIKELELDTIERTIDDAARLMVRATEAGPAFEFSEDTIQELLINENALEEIDWDQLAQEATDRGDDVVEDLADDLDKESVIQAVAKILLSRPFKTALPISTSSLPKTICASAFVSMACCARSSPFPPLLPSRSPRASR